jgi:hypothetical protein
MKRRAGLFQMLPSLYHEELVFLADKLSQNREKWHYDKRRKSVVRNAIVSNSDEQTLARVLKKSLGEEMPSGNSFPEVLQSEKQVLGPLGCLESVEQRTRYEADTISKIFTTYLRGATLLEKVISECRANIPAEVQSSAIEKKGRQYKPTIVQLVLTYFDDKQICVLVNTLLGRKDLQVDISSLYENIEYQWIVTRYGITEAPEEEAIENLARLIRDYHNESDLGPELKPYSGDFKTRLLEYCIMENPEVVLLKLFGLPEMRRIAKKLGFASENIGTVNEVASIILLGLGFDVPPTLSGLGKHLATIEKYSRDLSETKEAEGRCAIMSQVFVIAERALRDIVYFYIFFLWSNRMKDLELTIEEEAPDLGPRQIRIKSLDLFIGKKFGIRKPFEKLGFGDFANLIRTINNVTRKSDPLRKKMSRKLGKTSVLERSDIEKLESISPFRASFAHAKNYPGDEKCEEICKSVLALLRDFQRVRTYPLVIRISREVSDDYGKRYAECVDENGEEWLVYTEDEYLETSYPYFFSSQTPRIAIEPVIIKKIF